MTGRLTVKNGKYYVVISYKDSLGNHKSKWVATGLDEKNNKRAANDMLRDIVSKFENGELNVNSQPVVDTESPLFSNYLHEWLQAAKPNLQVSTYANYLRLINVAAKYFEKIGLKLIEIKPKHIQDFYTYLQLEQGKSTQVCRHYHIIIHRALQVAYRSDLIPTNPADKIQKPKIQKYKAKFYTAEQLKILFDKLKGDPYEHIYKLTALYGMRRSEVVGLRWSSIDFENNTLTIDHAAVECNVNGKRVIVIKDTMKTQSSLRTLPLFPIVKDMLLKLKDEQKERVGKYGKYYNPKYLDYVCVDETGNLIRPDTLSLHFKTFLARHRLPIIRFHELRHSCASILISSGVSMKAVQEWLGHSTFSTTADIYSHLSYASKLGIADTLSGVFGGNSAPQNNADAETLDTMKKIFCSNDIETAQKQAEKTLAVCDDFLEEDFLFDNEPTVMHQDKIKDEPVESVFPELSPDSVMEFKRAKEEMQKLGFSSLEEYFEYLEFVNKTKQRNPPSGSM